MPQDSFQDFGDDRLGRLRHNRSILQIHIERCGSGDRRDLAALCREQRMIDAEISDLAGDGEQATSGADELREKREKRRRLA